MAPSLRGSLSAAALAMVWCNTSALRRGKVHQKQASQTLGGVPLFSAEGPQALADEWMVAFGPKATDATLDAFCAQNGPCTHVGHPDEGGVPFVAVKGSRGTVGVGVEAHQSDIEFVEQDAVAEDFGRFEDSLKRKGGGPWNLNSIGVAVARSKGKGVNVYVLDSGVRVTHEAFGGRAIPLLDARKTPPEVCDPKSKVCARDRRGHGTHVAGTVGSSSWGVAPEATIFAMNRGNALSDGYGCMDWLAQNRKRPAVLQLSWGTYAISEVARAAVDAVVAAGITAVAGAGNNNDDACGFTFAWIPNVISVAASDIELKRSSFSNFGSCVDIFAPGSSIPSCDYETDDEDRRLSGTSMAGPHVAGAAALVLAANPEMAPDQVKGEILATALVDAIEDAKSPNFYLQVGTPEPEPSR